MKAAAVKANKPNESRAAANSIFQKKNNPKGTFSSIRNRPGPAAGRVASVPNGPAAASKFIRLNVPSRVSGSHAPIQARFVFDDGTVVNQPDQFANVGVTFTNLDAQIQSGLTWMVHDRDELEWLDVDARVEVLTPHRHVIGENHNASNFGAMRVKWPQAAAMAEGATHTVEEANLQLPADQGHGSHNIFDTIAQVTNQAVQPLENFHAANMVRMALFLTQWNEQRATQPAPFSWLNNPNRRRLIPETASIANQYVTLAVGVYLRGLENRKWWQIDPRFGTAVEEEYNRLYEIARGERAVRALGLLDGFRNQVNMNVSPTPTLVEYNDVKWYIRQLLTPIKNILVTSIALGSGDQGAIQGANTFGTYLSQHADTMRDAQVNAVLASGNVPREIYMARHIGGLTRPGLVKVGFAHIAGLQGLNIANTLYYNNWQDFDAATMKDQAGL